MVILSDIFDVDELEEEVENGFVTRRYNDAGTLAVLNYSPATQYSKRWNSVTKACRGLIYNVNTMEVVARPFEKFFNWDEGAIKYPPPGPVLRMPKMDGSLGILYLSTGGVRDHRIATRGSMNSEQAVWATEKYRRMVGISGPLNADVEATMFQPVRGKTYLFEIIYPENRIVVNYGDQERLTLLDVIDNETGFSDVSEFESCAWPDKVDRVPLPGFDSGQVVDIPPGEEGFVYLWPTRNFRTKLKAADYIELHRIIFNLTPKNIWRAILAGKTLEEIKEPFPDEFYREIDSIYRDIELKANAIRREVVDSYMKVVAAVNGNVSDRKAYAQAVKKHAPRNLQGIMFMLLDNKDIQETILRMVEPKGDKPRLEEE